jgi:hypothetical protein
MEGVDFSTQVWQSSGGRPAERILFSLTGFKPRRMAKIPAGLIPCAASHSSILGRFPGMACRAPNPEDGASRRVSEASRG